MFFGRRKQSEAAAPERVTESRVLDVLRRVRPPSAERDVVTLGLVRRVTITPNPAGAAVDIVVDAPPAVLEQIAAQAKAVVQGLPGVGAVNVVGQAVRGNEPSKPPNPLPGVRYVIAVASGKGGVGKSTVSANLALALAGNGANVGLLDADVYGPTVPTLFGVSKQPVVRDAKIVPIEAHGIRFMSLGLLVAPEQATVWRGPMVSQAVQQLLRDVAWGELDYLLVDLPPGTGDVPLTLAQALRLTGVVIVTTPQDVALNIATRSLLMFRGLHVPILGIVENMSFFVCPSCGERHDIFGKGGAQQASEHFRVPLLGEIPLTRAIRESGDAGQPIVATSPGSPEAEAFAAAARKLAARIKVQSRRSLPVIQASAAE